MKNQQQTQATKHSDNKDIDDIDDDDEEEGPTLVPFVMPKEKPAPQDKKTRSSS
jgi:hypothetical protein